MVSVRYVEADRKPFLTCSFTDTDLSAFASIVLRVKRPDGTTIQRDAVIDDAPTGQFHFAWQAGDIQYGISLAEIIFTDSGGLTMTLPNDAPIQLLSRTHL